MTQEITVEFPEPLVKPEPREEAAVCPLCKKVVANLKSHITKWHIGQTDKIICDTCGKTFANELTHENHVRNVHQGVRDHVCELCGHTSSRWAGTDWKINFYKTESAHIATILYKLPV